MKKITAMTAILLFSTGAAFAAELDANGDGAVTFEEFLAVLPTTTEEAFAAIDTDASGALSAEEIAAAEEAGLIPVEG
ncbi:EF hand domain-containing protein [Rhodovulum bhavnagarense]|uniref:EF hand domain-containing protein n=1 Tax=Rhodovulum bhavnagarense TaxID=992286 RepID=A0A4R2RKG5_9RHOB|nr:EF-hand domain-containing protein [Rhodovulum bhavnagarense]TCP63414.1 EF hand domain-containing protein [Rhodovulum bhavnagarense]